MMDSRNTLIIDQEIKDEEDIIEIKIHQPTSNASNIHNDATEPEESTRLLLGNDSSESDTETESEDFFPPTITSSPLITTLTPSPIAPNVDSSISSVQYLFFQPTQSSLPLSVRHNKEIQEINQVLSYMETSLKLNLTHLSTSSLTLKQLADMQLNIGENKGKNLMQAIAQQKTHINSLRWMPYIPTIFICFPLIPPLWKLPFSMVCVLISSQIDRHCFSKYNNDLKKLEHIATKQQELYEKKEKIKAKFLPKIIQTPTPPRFNGFGNMGCYI